MHVYLYVMYAYICPPPNSIHALCMYVRAPYVCMCVPVYVWCTPTRHRIHTCIYVCKYACVLHVCTCEPVYVCMYIMCMCTHRYTTTDILHHYTDTHQLISCITTQTHNNCGILHHFHSCCCLYKSLSTYIHTYIRTYMYTCMHTYTHTYIHTTCICMYTFTLCIHN
jgi:hypothetical protein